MPQLKAVKPVPIVLADGRERALYYTFEAAELFELSEQRMSKGEITKARHLVNMVHAGLIWQAPDLTPADIQRLMEMANSDYYSECIGEALRIQRNPTLPAAREETPAPAPMVNGAALPTGSS
jgi:hypothetical protein